MGRNEDFEARSPIHGVRIVLWLALWNLQRERLFMTKQDLPTFGMMWKWNFCFIALVLAKCNLDFC